MELIGLSGYQSVSQGLSELGGGVQSPHTVAQFHVSPSEKSVVLELNRNGGDSPMARNGHFQVLRPKERPPAPVRACKQEDIIPPLQRPLYRVLSVQFPLSNQSDNHKQVIARVQRRGSKGFMLGAALSFLLRILPVQVKRPSEVFKKQTLRLFLQCSQYGQFLSSQLGSFECGMYVLKAFVPHRGFRSFLSAIASGCSVYQQPRGMRQPLAQFQFVRAAEAIVRYSVEQEWQPRCEYGENQVFAFSTFTLVYGWLNQPQTVSSSYNKFLTTHIGQRSGNVHAVAQCHDRSNCHVPRNPVEAKKWGYPGISLKYGVGHDTPFTGILPESTIHSVNSYLRRTDQSPVTRNINRHDVLCQLLHPGYNSCSHGNLYQLPFIIKSSLKTYAPVHLLPLQLFKFPSLWKQPKEVLLKFAQGTARSATFLSSLIYFTFYLTCVYRNVIQLIPFSPDTVSRVMENGAVGTPGFADTIQGSAVSPFVFPFTASISSFFSLYQETPGRRVELVLYLASQALQTLQQQLQHHGIVKRIDAYASLAFIGSYAVIMATYVTDPLLMRPSNFSLIHFLYGSGGRSQNFPSTRDELAKTNEWLRQIGAWSKDNGGMLNRPPRAVKSADQPGKSNGQPPLPKRSSLSKSDPNALFSSMRKTESIFGLQKYLGNDNNS